GLRVDDLVDERLDYQLATATAQQYLNDLQQAYGDEKGLFAFIYDPSSLQGSYMNDSVREHTLSAIDALTSFQKAIDKQLPTATTRKTDTASFKQDVLIGSLIAQTNLSKDVFQFLNPALTGEVIPAGFAPVYLPVHSKKQLNKTALLEASNSKMLLLDQQKDSIRQRILSGIPDPKKYQIITYKVRSGDYLGAIARRHAVSVSSIKKWNNLTSNMIRPSQLLDIYIRKGTKAKPVVASNTTKKLLTQDENQLKTDITTDRPAYEIYEVKPGDTLWGIAKQYEGVSAEDITRWNNISNERIDIGQKLKIKSSDK
ncbi:MAG: LysM peptidoglycan-binding domain-containing protein, partial [Bacteroidota bacterium]